METYREESHHDVLGNDDYSGQAFPGLFHGFVSAASFGCSKVVN